jgi:hypothetical protein
MKRGEFLEIYLLSLNHDKEGTAADREIGEGLMETLSFHPSGKLILMAGSIVIYEVT